jgi:hypothetical protein
MFDGFQVKPNASGGSHCVISPETTPGPKFRTTADPLLQLRRVGPPVR